MPTIRAVFPIALNLNVEISRDFDLNVEHQVAEALYQQLMALDEQEGIDFLIKAITQVGEGKPTVPTTSAS